MVRRECYRVTFFGLKDRSVHLFTRRVSNRAVAALELQKLVTGYFFLAGGIEFPKKFSHRQSP
jgi:hypothetical protein